MTQTLTLVVFGIGCLMAVLRPGWGLALVMSMFTLEQALQASSPIFLRFLSLANVLVALSVGFGVSRSLLQQNRPFLGYASAVWIGVITLHLWACATLLWTPAYVAALSLTTSNIPYLILFIVFAPLLVDGIDSIESFLRAYLLLGSAVVVVILINPNFTFKLGRLGVDLSALVRSNPLAMGELGGSLMLVAVLFRIGVRSAYLTLLRFAAFFLGAILALQSGSRGQSLFAVVLALVFYPLSTKIKNIMGFVWTAIGAVVLIPVVLILAGQLLGSSEIRRWDADVLAGGTEIRVANAMDLISAFLRYPPAWVAGLGSNAFSAYTAASHEPYSHFLFLDIVTELGIPMFVMFCAMSLIVWRDSRWLFNRFAEDPVPRASLSVLFALLGYQILLVNKQGYLWAASTFFLLMVVLTRIRQRTEAADTEWAMSEEGQLAMQEAHEHELEREREQQFEEEAQN